MFSTITESLLHQHLELLGHKRLQSCNWLQLRPAKGVIISCIAYLELDVEHCVKLIAGCVVLVVQDLLEMQLLKFLVFWE